MQTCHRQCYSSYLSVGAAKFLVPVIPPFPSVDQFSVHLENRGTRAAETPNQAWHRSTMLLPSTLPHFAFTEKTACLPHPEARCEDLHFYRLPRPCQVREHRCSSGSTVSHQERPLTRLGSPCPSRTG